MTRPNRGFTLVEALICIAVAAILLCVMGPAYADLVQRSRAAAARAALLDSIVQAVRHAALAGREVVLCPSADNDAVCNDTSDWSKGWMAYADIDGSRSRGAGETLVVAEPALADGVHLLTSAGRKRLVFQPTGGNAGSNATFTLCDRRGEGSALSLVLSNSGRLHASTAAPAAARRCAGAGH